MAENFTDEILRELGLDDSVLADVQVVEVLGLAGGVRREEKRPEFGAAPWAEEHAEPVNARVIDEMSFEVVYYEAWPGILGVKPPGSDFHVITASTPKTEAVVSRSREGSFLIDVRQAKSPVAVVDEAGEGLLLAVADERLVVEQVIRLPDELFAPLEVESPLETWIASSEDSWLRKQVEKRLDRCDPWHHLVAMGLYYRLRRPRQRGDMPAEDAVKLLLAGETLPRDENVLTWTRQLDGREADRLASLTLATMEQLREELDELSRDFDGDEIVLERDIQNALYLRDDIECALVMLGHTSVRDRLSYSVQSVDRHGQALVSRLVGEFDAQVDERLMRAISSTPEGWWTEVVNLDAAAIEMSYEQKQPAVAELVVLNDQRRQVSRHQFPREVMRAAASSGVEKEIELASDANSPRVTLMGLDGDMIVEIGFDEIEPIGAAIVVECQADEENPLRRSLELQVSGRQAECNLGSWHGEDNVLRQLIRKAEKRGHQRDDVKIELELSYE